MSTTAVPTTTTAGRTGSGPAGAPSAGTLAKVELRKMVDTRAGRWILIAAGLIVAIVAIVRMFTGDEVDRTVGGAFQFTLIPAGVLLPVVGILAATGEWSQRTALTTFALVPRRGRIVGAKLTAAVALAAAGLLLGVVASLVAGVIASAAGSVSDPWTLNGGDAGQAVLFSVISVLWGMAFGLALFAPAVAIVSYFVLPTVFTLLGQISDGLGDALAWVDPNEVLSKLSDGTTAGDDWAKIALCVLLWVALPMGLGIVRTLRREVK